MSASPMVEQQMQAVRVMPQEYLRAKFEDPDFLDTWFEAVKSRLQAGKRDAIRLVAEVLKLVGPSTQVALLIYQKFGASSEYELEAFVRRGKSIAQFEEAPVETHWREAMGLLKMCLAERPDLRAETLRELESEAVIVEDGNGLPHTNGGPQ